VNLEYVLGQIDADHSDSRKIGDYLAHVDGAPQVDL
jgi:hypothetical protein